MILPNRGQSNGELTPARAQKCVTAAQAICAMAAELENSAESAMKISKDLGLGGITFNPCKDANVAHLSHILLYCFNVVALTLLTNMRSTLDPSSPLPTSSLMLPSSSKTSSTSSSTSELA
jgi:hypothetical protein